MSRNLLTKIVLAAACIAPLALVACYGNDHKWYDPTYNNAPICNGGETRACTCNLGTPGQQVCHTDGLDYSPCECLDAGAGSAADAGVDGATTGVTREAR